MSTKMISSFSKEMQNMDAASLLRAEVAVTEFDDMEVTIADKEGVLNFFGSDLLAWRSHEEVKKVALSALQQYGTGSTSSRATLGTMEVIAKLEKKLCDFLDVEACIVLSSRYLANIGIFDALTNERDSIFIDEGCDHGLIDGVRFSKAKAVVYNFKDYANLEYQLKCSESARYRLIASDGIFYTDGDWASLETIESLKNKYDAISVIDDSLGVGILGENGQGTFNHLGLEAPDLLSGAFSYGLGNVAGGFIAGNGTLVEWLRQSSRSYLLSEPLSPIHAEIVLKVIELLESDQSNTEALFYNANLLKERLREKAWSLIQTEHPYVSIIVGSTLVVQKMVEALYEKSILVSGLCYPNAPEGAARIRIHVSAKHSTKQIDRLVTALEDVRYLMDKGIR